MKKPYLNQEDRRIMKIDCREGAILNLRFAYKKFERSVYQEAGIIKGFFIMWKINKINLLQPYGKKTDPILSLSIRNPYSYSEIKNFIDKTNCSIEETQQIMDEMTSLGIGFGTMEDIIGGYESFKKNETKTK